MGISLKNELYARLNKDEIDAIEAAVRVAKKTGTKIYLIGGIVRDLILNNPLKDIDIIVGGDAPRFAAELEKTADFKVTEIQENLRTAKTVYKETVEIDFASTREEKYSASGILPVAYNFGCKINDDVKRRDFTINTLYLDLTGGFEVIDFYDGTGDISRKTLKILHDKSFEDDPSRIIRGLKFKERFGFDFDENTSALMQKYLENPSKDMPLERIKGELKQYFEINKPKIYEKFVKSGAYKLICDNPVAISNEEEIKKLDDGFFVYFALLIMNAEDFSRYNLTAAEKKAVLESKNLVSRDFSQASKKEIYDAFIKCEKSAVTLYRLIKNDKAVNLFLNELKDIKVEISGKDLTEKGYKPSKAFGEAFDKIIEAKIDGRIKTKEEELSFAEKYLSENG